jgi:hypothetical protein
MLQYRIVRGPLDHLSLAGITLLLIGAHAGGAETSCSVKTTATFHNIGAEVAFPQDAVLTAVTSHVQGGETESPAPGIDLRRWKLTLPEDASGTNAGKAVEVSPSALVAGYSHPSWFHSDSKGQLVFWCPVSGATTENTAYPRCELREMLDPADSSVNWPAQGTHVLEAQCQVNQIPSEPKVIIGQIHSYSGKAKPLVKLQFYKNRIEALVKVNSNKGTDRKLVFPEVGLNRDIRYRLKLHDGVLTITVNGVTQTENILANDATWSDQAFYFKAGCYPQDSEGPATEGARVTYSALWVRHAPEMESGRDRDAAKE